MPSLLRGAIPNSRASRVHLEKSGGLTLPIKKDMAILSFKAMVGFARMLMSAIIELVATYVG